MSVYTPREWLPHEKPMLPGSPSTPHHPVHRRINFLLIGMLVTITGGLGNALVSVNLVNLQGTLGAMSTEINWLPAAYMMTNLSINLMLVKVRQQFGLRLFAESFIILYALITFGHLFVNDLNSAIAVRAAHGIVGAALSTLGILYMIQAFPAKYRLNGLAMALGVAQLATPLSRIFSSELLEFGEWRGLYLFELGLALASLAGVLWLKLPPSDRIRVFEKLDFLTFSLFAPGMALLCVVLTFGRLLWWTETPWIGICLAISIVLITAAWAIEHHRKNPLINTRWLSSGKILGLALAVMLIRVIYTEQTTGAVGFMQAVGMSNDQMRALFIVVLAGTVAGIVTSAVSLNPKHLTWPIILSLLLMMAGALMDAQATSMTRPSNIYLSQFLLSFGGAFFLAPAMIMGIGDVIANPRNLISFSVMFGMSQNIGGLVGGALLGTFQIVREKYHSSYLVEHLTLLDPQVVSRLQVQASPFAKILVDPALIQEQGVSALHTVATREANILAYNDTFMLVAIISAGAILWLTCKSIKEWNTLQKNKKIMVEDGAAAGA